MTASFATVSVAKMNFGIEKKLYRNFGDRALLKELWRVLKTVEVGL